MRYSEAFFSRARIPNLRRMIPACGGNEATIWTESDLTDRTLMGKPADCASGGKIPDPYDWIHQRTLLPFQLGVAAARSEECPLGLNATVFTADS